MPGANRWSRVIADHPLHGAWQGCRDCHIRGDVVLIYSLPPGLAVFHRVGPHSELFRW